MTAPVRRRVRWAIVIAIVVLGIVHFAERFFVSPGLVRDLLSVICTATDPFRLYGWISGSNPPWLGHASFCYVGLLFVGWLGLAKYWQLLPPDEGYCMRCQAKRPVHGWPSRCPICGCTLYGD
jgi:hypothetical protein